jgi:WD40 repeat protein
MLEGHSDWVTSVAFSQDGKRVVSGSDDKTVQIWNVETGEQEKKMEGHSDYVRSVAFSHDGKRVVSGSDDKTVKIWNVQTGEEEKPVQGYNISLQTPLIRNKQWVYSSVSGSQCGVPYSNVSACTSSLPSIATGLETGYILIVKNVVQ